MTEDFVAAATWLKNRPDSTGKLGAVGFCFGGGSSTRWPSMGADLSAGVPFYGGPPTDAEVARQGTDLGASARPIHVWPAAGPLTPRLSRANKIPHDGYIYPKAEHGFFNDTTPRYDAAASKVAWERTLAWFNKYLRS